MPVSANLAFAHHHVLDELEAHPLELPSRVRRRRFQPHVLAILTCPFKDVIHYCPQQTFLSMRGLGRCDEYVVAIVPLLTRQYFGLGSIYSSKVMHEEPLFVMLEDGHQWIMLHRHETHQCRLDANRYGSRDGTGLQQCRYGIWLLPGARHSHAGAPIVGVEDEAAAADAGLGNGQDHRRQRFIPRLVEGILEEPPEQRVVVEARHD